MSNTAKGGKSTRQETGASPAKKDIKLLESPVERALRLSSEQILALAIRDMIKRDELS